MFVLAVDLDQIRRQFLQAASRRQRSIHERAAPALRANLAPHQDFRFSTLEDGFDCRSILTRPDQVTRCTSSKQQPDGLHENRFARSGFARQDVQAGVEFDLSRIDNREVGNAQETQHLKRENSNPNIGLTAVFEHATVFRTIRGSNPEGAVPAAHSYLPEGRLRTLGSPFFALQLQGQDGAVSGSSGSQILDLLSHTTYVSRFVLLILALFSIASWTVILYKLWIFQRAARQTTQFIDVFRRSNKFSEVQAVCGSLGASPLVGLFQAGYTELTAQLRGHPAADAGNPQAAAGRPTLKSLTSVDRALLRASSIEVNKLERRLPLLATTASVAPFIGLFGTVWGIMTAFLSIGQTGSTSLAVVGTPIAEALIATAFGLAAAIPALVAYNHMSNRVRLFASEMDDFSMEFLNIAERNFT